MTNAVSIAQLGANNSSFTNRIINGAMVIDQRNATVTSTAAGAYITDRWNTYADQAYSIARDSDAPSGYAYSLKVTKTSSSQSSYAFLVQYVEGLNCIDLAFGTASAATVTISFWVRSSITGNFAVSLTNSAENRTYAALYAINSANTWEQKTVTIAGDTSGTWLKTNGKGISLQFNYGQAAGAGAVNTWVSATNIAPSGCTNLGTTNGATFYITGVQLEKGSTATSFDYRPYGTELDLCYRYYFQSNQFSTYSPIGVGRAWGSGNGNAPYYLPAAMRSNPTITYSSLSHFDVVTLGNPTAIQNDGAGTNNVKVGWAKAVTSGNLYQFEFGNQTNGWLGFSAEL